MPLYTYVAVDESGHKTKGRIEAKDRATVVNTLRKSQMVIVSIREDKGGGGGGKKVRLEDLVIFTRQLAALVKAGIPLIRGLRILGGQMENKSLKEVTAALIAKIESGSSLSDAMLYYPKVFSKLYINMIKAGELSGALDSVLDRLAIFLESMNSLNRKVKGAFIYPSVIVAVTFLITSVIFLKVIPGFASIFASLNAKLPLPTLIVLKMSEIFRQYFLVIVGAGFVGFIVFKKLSTKPFFQLFLDRMSLKLPVLGKVVLKVVIARFTRTLATLVKSGVSVLVALDIGSKTAGNKVVEDVLTKAISRVSKGERIGDALTGNNIFPPLVVNLISVGEETGDMESMLEKIAIFYEDEVEVVVSSMTSLLEPIIILFLGVVIGGIVLALFLPILTITQLVGKG